MYMQIAPSMAPQDFRSVDRTATSVTFQWTDLTESEANGIARNYTIICLSGNTTFLVSEMF